MTEGAADHPWFLRKHEDGAIFGPLRFEQLARWAAQAQVAPHDSISTDQQNWIKAPMLPELRMDWIVEVTSERLYGPTTLGAIREFIELGEIGAETFVINSCDATRYRVRDLAELLAADAPDEQVQSSDPAPVAAGMSIAADDRIRELEEALREERRALAEADERYRELEAAYRSLIEAGQAG